MLSIASWESEDEAVYVCAEGGDCSVDYIKRYANKDELIVILEPELFIGRQISISAGIAGEIWRSHATMDDGEPLERNQRPEIMGAYSRITPAVHLHLSGDKLHLRITASLGSLNGPIPFVFGNTTVPNAQYYDMNDLGLRLLLY